MFRWLLEIILKCITAQNIAANLSISDRKDTPLLQKSAAIHRPNQKKTSGASNSIETHLHSISAKNISSYPAIFALIILIMGIFFRPLLIITAFAGAAVISRLYQKHIRFPLGIELGVFGTVICAALYGPLMGALVGLLAYPISIIYTKEEAKYLPVALFGIIVVAFAAGSVTLNPANLVTIGIALTILYDILTGGLYYYLYRAPVITGTIFAVTHIWFNYIIFSSLGTWVLNILM